MNSSQPIHAEYISRINKAFDYIECHLEKALTLEEIAAVAHFSKFHFNRIFHSLVGETPFQFIQRLRLEKAASFLLANRQEPIAEIAFRCGFSDVSVFSRNFKRYFKVSASQYRRAPLHNSNISQVNRNKAQQDHPSVVYFCPESQTTKWRINMELNKGVEVLELPQMTVAYIRNMGPYNGDQELYQRHRNKLFAWGGARGLLGGKDFKYLVLYHDNPQVALSDNLRMSLCLTVPENTVVGGEIGKRKVDAARYAIGRFELTPPDFPKAWDWMYGHWLPANGFQPDDKPYFETYPEEPKGDTFVVDFCIPVKPV